MKLSPALPQRFVTCGGLPRKVETEVGKHRDLSSWRIVRPLKIYPVKFTINLPTP